MVAKLTTINPRWMPEALSPNAAMMAAYAR